jgi:hypothetical protein
MCISLSPILMCLSSSLTLCPYYYHQFHYVSIIINLLRVYHNYQFHYFPIISINFTMCLSLSLVLLYPYHYHQLCYVHIIIINFTMSLTLPQILLSAIMITSFTMCHHYDQFYYVPSLSPILQCAIIITNFTMCLNNKLCYMPTIIINIET